MADFTSLEQAMMSKELSEQQKMLFASQYGAAKKDPGTLVVLSVLFGFSGIDRFMLGDTGMGLLKLFTLGGCGLLAIYDWFAIQSLTHDYNRTKANEILSAIKLTSPSVSQSVTSTPPSLSASVPPPPSASTFPSAASNYCTECGASIAASAKFCTKCGTRQAAS